MAISQTLKRYLENSGVEYDLIKHDYAVTSMHTAEKAHISGEDLAKAVLVRDGDKYVLAVLPATHHLQLGKLHRQHDRYMSLATEPEVAAVFDDCDVGAMPPLGDAYGLEVIIDSHLVECDDVYFEAGDHTDLVHVSGYDFRNLMAGAYHGEISRHS